MNNCLFRLVLTVQWGKAERLGQVTTVDRTSHWNTRRASRARIAAGVRSSLPFSLLEEESRASGNEGGTIESLKSGSLEPWTGDRRPRALVCLSSLGALFSSGLGGGLCRTRVGSMWNRGYSHKHHLFYTGFHQIIR